MFSLILSVQMNALIMIKRCFYMYINYVILSIMAALSVVAIYAAALIRKNTRAEQWKAKKVDVEPTDPE